mmetsp:Transcript_2793/g.8209  ORF Transcript_2793/g.8209 Transcript_2793/m.8209 type:complete len:183 (+) Transcript_2793:370-918(+)
MGYAGYVPTKYAPKLSGVQLALKAVQDEAAYDLLGKLMKNLAVNPAEDKYRRLRLSNPRIEAALKAAPNALPALEALGWQSDPEDADFLVCPKSVKPSMAEVRLIEEAKADFKKDARSAKRSAAGKALATGVDQQRIAAQLAADRAERAAAGPVGRGSTAQALPNLGMKTASEAGIGSGGDC